MMMMVPGLERRGGLLSARERTRTTVCVCVCVCVCACVCVCEEGGNAWSNKKEVWRTKLGEEGRDTKDDGESDSVRRRVWAYAWVCCACV